ncbi:hypothetical protein Dxin01_03817 [Deinococcus xinjiangensis]|uniref:AAA domain-containing protein n=1 Tax=Deinococcus xinjiangensis TaxID=457454 RepID=A0ABP9VFP8_9DEIO
MKPHELPDSLPISHRYTWTLTGLPQCATGQAKPLEVTSEVRFQYLEVLEEVQASYGEVTWPVSAQAKDLEAIKLLLMRGLPYIAWVSSVSSSSFAVQADVFSMGYRLPDPAILGIDEQAVDRMRSALGARITPDRAAELLTEELTLPALPGGMPRFLYVGSSSRHPDREKALRLLGKRVNIDLAMLDGQWLVMHVTLTKKGRVNEMPVTLLEADWQFSNVTVAARERERLQAQGVQVRQDQHRYLKLWEEYQEIGRQRGQRLSRQLGAIPYLERPEFWGGFWMFRANVTPEQLAFLRQQGNLTLRATETRPPDVETPVSTETRPRRVQEFIGECQVTPNGVIRLLPLSGDEVLPPAAGWLSLSLAGDQAQFARRDRARLAIATGTNAMPQLSHLLEGREVPQRRLQREPALPGHSQAAAAFRGTPTARQIEALDVALNTPDIALIQGPPGTGKTRVIAALQQRLADIAKDRSRLPGHTLLTSAQHVAVENAAEATKVFGLPSVKVDRSRRFREEFSDAVDHWRRDMIVQLQGRLSDAPEQPLEVRYVRLRDEVLRVSTAPSPKDNVREVARQLLEEGGTHLKPMTRDRLLEVAGEQRQVEIDDEEREYLMNSVRALRTTPEAFSDDGPRQAQRCLRRLAEADSGPPLSAEDRALLEACAQWDQQDPPPLLPALSDLKERLLTALQPQLAPLRPEPVSRAVTELLNAALEDLRQAARREQGGIATILHDMLSSLENDPEGTRAAIKNYTAVLAATCQQSDSQAVRQTRTALGNEARVFENVVVDEAARVHPLDLLIPMAQAERRIILVGDHRQLPHLLEPDVERELQSGWHEASIRESNSAALHQSLFERLFQTLREREQRDGIKRVVTLDQQYRMHPELGKFVSDTFYKAHNPSEAFGSGRPAEEFAHGLAPYGDAVAVWVDVPHELGAERGGKSKSRRIEAQVVAREAERILNARPDFSVGVISFYAEQVKVIRQEMEAFGLTQKGEDNEYRIHPDYQDTYDRQGHSRERLRVGTVDAFQGMEFDVVLLSLTRSNTLPAHTAEEQRRRYGHLTLENRLCVAMSRQQRLLILVGDTGMLAPAGTESAVPALEAFYELCRGAYGRII